MKNYLSVVAIAKDEEPYIDEFIYYYKLLGVDHFYIYDNGSAVPMSETLKHHKKYITVINYPGEVKQLEAYKHYCVTYGKDSRWAAFIDIDEFIVPKTTYKLSDFLRNYEHVDALGINWMIFGHNGHETKPEGLITENFIKAEGKPNLHIKTIANPRKIQFFQDAHSAIMVEGSVYVDAKNNPITGPYNENDSTDLIQINHYYIKSLEEWKRKVSRGRADLDIKKTEDSYTDFFKMVWNSTPDTILADKYLPDLKNLMSTKEIAVEKRRDNTIKPSTSNRLERLWLLAKIEFKLRYYENKLGLFWAVIKPLMDLLIYYIVFQTVMKQDVPNFASYLFIGLIFFNFFLESTSGTIQILRTKKYLYEYTNMNKIEIYLSTLFSNTIGFFFNLIVFILFYLFLESGNNNVITWKALFLIPLYINIFVVSLGFSLILSTTYIIAKDINQIWMVFTNFFFFVSPLFFKLSTFRENVPGADYVNPLSGIIINARKVVMDNVYPEWDLLLFDFGYALLVLFIGIIMLKRLGSKAAEKL